MESSTSLPPARRPDLDWSQVRETVRMLDVAVAQMQMFMTEGNESVGTLTHLFTSVAGMVAVIGRIADQLPDNPDATTQKAAILSHCESVAAKMQASIIAMQFYDRLTQRLSHVSDSLAELADLIGDPARLYLPVEWFGLQEKIRSLYTIEQERAMFDALMGGASVGEVLDRLRLARRPQRGAEVELF
ncbi:MAG: hypothetical protein U1F68_04545 [Gammaproteobacteria bacterium]